MISGRSILKQSIPVLSVCAVISIFSGIFLDRYESLLRVLPGILIIVPSFIAVNGNISSVISSRLSGALHMGLVKPDFRRSRVLTRNIYAVLIDSLVAFPFLGFLAAAMNIILGSTPVSFIIFPIITFCAGMITITALIFASIFFSYLSYRKGIDPDNIVIPILTTTGDFIGISTLLLITAMVF